MDVIMAREYSHYYNEVAGKWKVRLKTRESDAITDFPLEFDDERLAEDLALALSFSVGFKMR